MTKMAKRMKYSVVGLPHYTIWHLYEPSVEDLKHMEVSRLPYASLSEQLSNRYTRRWRRRSRLRRLRRRPSSRRSRISRNLSVTLKPNGRKTRPNSPARVLRPRLLVLAKKHRECLCRWRCCIRTGTKNLGFIFCLASTSSVLAAGETAVSIILIFLYSFLSCIIAHDGRAAIHLLVRGSARHICLRRRLDVFRYFHGVGLCCNHLFG